MSLRNSVTDLNPRNEPSMNAAETLRVFNERGREPIQADGDWKPGMVIAAVIPASIRDSWFAQDAPGKRPSVALFTQASGIQTNTRPGTMAIYNAESVGFFAIDPATRRFFLSSAKPFDYNQERRKAERPYGVKMDHVFVFKDLEEWQRFINRPA